MYNQNEFEEKSLLKILGYRLKELRKLKGLTIKGLAKQANIERNGYAKIENGERNVSIGLLCKIAIALDTTPNELFDDAFYKEYSEYLCANKFDIDDYDLSLLDVNKLSDTLKEYRKKLHLSQDGLAKLMNLNRGIINNIENGRGKINADLLIVCSNVLDIQLESLVDAIKK